MSTDVANTLRQARARVEDPKHFCKGTLARDGFGGEVAVTSPQACQWSLYGTLCAQYHANSYPWRVWDGMVRAVRDAGGGRVEFNTVNDNGGHAVVLAVLDRAIAAESRY